MALRQVPPLDEEQWKTLVDTMQKPPTEKHEEMMQEAEKASKLKVVE